MPTVEQYFLHKTVCDVTFSRGPISEYYSLIRLILKNQSVPPFGRCMLASSPSAQASDLNLAKVIASPAEDERATTKRLRRILLIINAETVIVTVLAVVSTYICKRLGLLADFPLTVITTAAVFPVVFSIGGAEPLPLRFLFLELVGGLLLAIGLILRVAEPQAFLPWYRDYAEMGVGLIIVGIMFMLPLLFHLVPLFRNAAGRRSGSISPPGHN